MGLKERKKKERRKEKKKKQDALLGPLSFLLMDVAKTRERKKGHVISHPCMPLCWLL